MRSVEPSVQGHTARLCAPSIDKSRNRSVDGVERVVKGLGKGVVGQTLSFKSFDLVLNSRDVQS